MATIRGKGGRDVLKGTNAADRIFGNGGNDVLNGLGGNDVLYGGAGNDVLKGGAGVDRLYGDSGNDTLDGGASRDTLRGGRGNDTYLMTGAFDTVVESSGIDRVILTDVLRYTMANGVENLIVNEYSRFDDGYYYGNSLANTMNASQGGAGGQVWLYGRDGNDTLTGARFADVLDGGAGTDRMAGGDGDDTYWVNLSTDVVIETNVAGAGSADLVYSTAITYTLAENVERLTLVGVTAITGIGNDEDNIITGSAADNRLRGGIGADELTGGEGADDFVFEQLSDSGFVSVGVDTIMDFAYDGGFGDQIDVSAIDADPNVAGDQEFRFITAAMTAQNDWPIENGFPEVGVIGWRVTGSTVTILANTDLDSDPELAIYIEGGGAVVEGWFVL